MSATKGNQFWKLRSKHGRDLLFESPELLWESACEYFDSVEENPFISEETTSKISHVEHKEIRHKRPFTLHALCLYLDCSRNYFNMFKQTCDTDLKKDFLAVITRIEDVIYSQKFEGASAGLFNSNIIARDLGLAEKTINENTNVPLMNIDPLSDGTNNGTT